MKKIRDLKNLMYELPFELQNIIRYKSGFITNEAKLIKDFNENLYIKKKRLGGRRHIYRTPN